MKRLLLATSAVLLMALPALAEYKPEHRGGTMRLLYGGLNSIIIAGAATLLTIFLATLPGLVAGFCGGLADTIISRVLDVHRAFPVYLLAISLSIVLSAQGTTLGPVEIDSGAPALPIFIIGLICISMPVCWLGEVMNLLTQSRFKDTWFLGWVPPLGYVPFSESPQGWFLSLVIPWFTLSILCIGLYARVLRAGMTEALQEDCIRTARAKGLSETRILPVHALRTSLIADPNARIEGPIRFRGQELVGLPARKMRRLRGRDMAMILQDPMTALTPVHTIGWQIAEQVLAHRKVTRRAA